MSFRLAPAHSSRWFMPAVLVASVVIISSLHYLASAHDIHALFVHEILKRLYYVPIVIAAMQYGSQGGLAISLLSSAMFLPHIVIAWSSWPVFEVGQYGEVVLLNVVGAVTGAMADRLRSERNLYREASQELERAYGQLEASTDQRIKAERMATVGRVAAGVAHEIRTPLSAILGCFEILGSDYPPTHPKQQFIAILKKEIARAETVVTRFLDFAQPAPTRRRPVDVNEIARCAARRFSSGRLGSNGGVQLNLSPSSLLVSADSDQLERAIAELLTTESALAPGESLTVTTVRTIGDTAEIHVQVLGLTHRIPEDAFETFDGAGCASALMLPLVRRLIENQGGTVSASTQDSKLDLIVALPQTKSTAQSTAHKQSTVAS